MEEQSLLCIDDIDSLVALPEWEHAFFHLFNKIRDKEQHRLIITAQVPPQQLLVQLSDLNHA